MWELNTPRRHRPIINKVIKIDSRSILTDNVVSPRLYPPLEFLLNQRDWVGYTRFYHLLTDTEQDPNSSGYYDIVNYYDGQLFYCLSSQGFGNVLSSPDGVIGPFQTQRVYVGDKPISFVASVAGYDHWSIRQYLAFQPFYPRGDQAGIYVCSLDNDETPFNLTPNRQYIRSYDIFDFSYGLNLVADVIPPYPVSTARGIALFNTVIPRQFIVAGQGPNATYTVCDCSNATGVTATITTDATLGTVGQFTLGIVALSLQNGIKNPIVVTSQDFTYAKGQSFTVSTNQGISQLMGPYLWYNGAGSPAIPELTELRFDINFNS